MIDEIYLTANKMHQARIDSLNNQFDYGWKPLFKDINDYLLPRRYNDVTLGKPYDPQNVLRSDNILNPTATRANRILGAGMQGGLCSPSRPWFRLTLMDEDLAEYGPVRSWLDVCEKIMYKVYAKCNFYTEAHNIFEEQGGFGTSVVLQQRDPVSIVRFIRFSPGEYRLASGPDNLVNTIYRTFWMTARQMQSMFGKASMSDNIQNALKTNPYEYFQVNHCIYPRENRNVDKLDASNMRYASRWFEVGQDEKTLRISGFNEKPFVAPRWSVPGQSSYGLGPGCDMIGNIKMLQEMERSGIKGLHREIEPPVNVPSKFKNVVSMLPGAENYTDDPQAKITPLFDVRLDQQKLEFKIQSIEDKIERHFYTDLFLLISSMEKSGRDVTATEILKRQEEKLLMLGPTIERQIFEFLDPTILRTFKICYEDGLFPPVPQDIIGHQLEVKYISILAQAQKLADAQSMEAHITAVERVYNMDQVAALAKTDLMEYLDQFGNTVGVPAKIVRSDEDAEKKYQEIVQAQAQAQQNEKLLAATQAAKNLGQANMDGNTALGQLREEMS